MWHAVPGPPRASASIPTPRATPRSRPPLCKRCYNRKFGSTFSDVDAYRLTMKINPTVIRFHTYHTFDTLRPDTMSANA